MSTLLRIVALSVACLAAVAAWPQAPPITTNVADVVYSPPGVPINGTLTITANQTFTASDGTVVLVGSVITSNIINGVINVLLVPNVNSIPTGSSYKAAYRTPSQNFTETWVVPQSSLPVNLLQVRTLPAPTPGIVIPASQLLPPPGCVAPKVLRWMGQGWDCKPDNLGTVSMNLEFPIPPDSGKFQWKPKNGLTLTRISCTTDSGQVTINLDVRTELNPGVTGNVVLSSPLVCNNLGTAASTLFSISAVGSLSPVALDIVSSVGSPGVVRVHAEYQLN